MSRRVALLLTVLIALSLSWGVSLVTSPFKVPKGKGNVPDLLEPARQPRTQIPDSPENQYGAIADPTKAGKGASSNQTSWTFKHEGASGADESETEFPAIELSRPQRISLQLLFDASVRGASRFDEVPSIDTAISYSTFDDTQFIGPVSPDEFRLVAGEPGGTHSILIGEHTGSNLVSYGLVQDQEQLLPNNLIQIYDPTDYGSGSGERTWTYRIETVSTGSVPDFLEVSAEFVSSTGPAPAPLNNVVYYIRILQPQPPTEIKPNAAVRARIKYTAGLAEHTFDCDWRGELELVASRLELSRVVFKPDDASPFHETSVRLGAIATLDGPTPRIPATYTVPAINVNAGAYRSIALPALAQRVSVLARYGGDPEDVGDVPLGQLFVSFATETGNAMGYIDAMSAREALFGLGLSIPAGAVDLLLVNLSPDPIDLGAIFHLGA